MAITSWKILFALCTIQFVEKCEIFPCKEQPSYAKDQTVIRNRNTQTCARTRYKDSGYYEISSTTIWILKLHKLENCFYRALEVPTLMT